MSSSRFEVQPVAGDGKDVDGPLPLAQTNNVVTSETKKSFQASPTEGEKKLGICSEEDERLAESSLSNVSPQIEDSKQEECNVDNISAQDKEKVEAPAQSVHVESKEEQSGGAEVVEVNNDEKKQSRFHVAFVGPPKASLSPSSPNDTLHDSHTKTYYQRTFGHNTQEAIPMVAYYRNTASTLGKNQRPTLDQLHEAQNDQVRLIYEQHDGDTNNVDVESPKATAPVKFGWVQGVLIRCMLNIWGVMLFLRVSWMVGQAGIGQSILIILQAAVVTMVTTLSMSAICTNGQVRGGGAYYLISRSLGPKFGGPIGLIFSFANMVGIALYVVGFAETIVDIVVVQFGLSITGDFVNDTRVIGVATLILLLGISQLGMAWESVVQMCLLVILLVSLGSFLIGTFVPASTEQMSKGFFNYRLSIIAENIGSNYRNGQNFISIFSLFFPAATGILAGCNISGDLKDPQVAIPKGTILAIIITTIVYIIMVLMVGSTQVRFASGDISDFIGATNASMLGNCTTAACEFGWDYAPINGTCVESVEAVNKCFGFGLLNDYQVMQKISIWGPLIVAGIIAATLSSGLASLVSAPKVHQAVGRDKIFPFSTFFAKGDAKTDEPRRGYLLAFVVALGFILIGKLNTIAPLISNFFLGAYALINYSCFSASLAKSPGWRPAFKFYNKWLSLAGAVMCCVIMFIISWWAALVTFVLMFILYRYVDHKKLDVNWGSSTQAYSYVQALNHTLKLSSVSSHVKNFRPQLLVLTGTPSHRPALVQFASQITKNISLMICANVQHPQGKNPMRLQHKDNEINQQWLKKQHLKAFYSSLIHPYIDEGILMMMQLSGLGKLRTNTILMGFKGDWQNVSGSELMSYINIIHNAFDMNYGVCILRMGEGLDVSQYLTDSDAEVQLPKSKSDLDMIKKESSFLSDASELPPDAEEIMPESERRVHNPERGSKKDVNAAALKSTAQFQIVQAKGKTIDVWWLFDDGGLTILIPYLLSTRQQFSGCRMRIFTGGKKERIDQDKRTMAQLLSKFRISFEDVIVVPDINQKPRNHSITGFKELIKPYRLFDEQEGAGEGIIPSSNEPWKITDNELQVLKDKTNRQIRLQELLQEHSKDAALIMMTLPIARKGTCSAALYMAWLEELSRDLPPIVLLRGNQTSVLTFYS